MITLKDIFDKIGYGNYGEFAVSGYGKEFNIHFTQEITSYESKIDEFIFWSIVLNPEFCKKVFEEQDDWYYSQIWLLEMRNQGKSIEEVLKYIELTTHLKF